MQWDGSPFAGFSTVEPWLPLAPDWEVTNVEAEKQEAGSMLNLVRALLQLRRAEPCLAFGSYRTLAVEGDVLIFARQLESRRMIVALNLEAEPKVVVFGEGEVGGRIALSTHLDREGEAVGSGLALRADEGVVIAVTA
jgi:alpha-glucosidase